jgi:hypothetical protein
MAHGHTVGDRYGAEFARRATGSRNPFLNRLGLTHKRDIAGRSLIPAGRNAYERLVYLFTG